MKRIIIGIIVLVSIFAIIPKGVQAGEADILVDKLVEKGVLTPVEAQIILDETKKQVAEEMAQGKSGGSPSWAQKIKLKGDLRLRYQFQKNETSETRNRGRVRYRLGAIAKGIKGIEVGAGIASGSSDARSTNQTFQDAFTSKGINLDYAYAKWTANDKLTMYGGKFKRKPVLWQTGDLLWDGDINPEGLAITWNDRLGDMDWFFNTGLWVLDESSGDTSDPYMYYFQPGIQIGLADGIKLKTGVSYFGFNSLRKTTLSGSAGTNTLDDNGDLDYKYDSINPNVEISFKEPFDGLFNYASIFGMYIQNLASIVDQDQGWQVGLKFGDKSVKKKGQWQGKYMYSKLERDAFPDAFPDSDRLDGETNVKGHEFIFQYSLMKNVFLGFDYYITEQINGTKDPQHLAQLDLQFKF